MPPRDNLAESLRAVLQHGASGKLRIATERVPLADVEHEWNRSTPGKRIVFVP